MSGLQRSLRRRLSVGLAQLLVAAALLAACNPPGDSNGGERSGRNDHMLLAEIYPHGFTADGLDQFIRLHNPTGRKVSLEGWSIGDSEIRAVFPAGAQVGAHQSIFVARDAVGFRTVMGAPPDYTWNPNGGLPGVPAMIGESSLRLKPEEGVVSLRDTSGLQIDTLVYASTAVDLMPGWIGSPVPVPMIGEVIDRARDEATWTGQRPGEYRRDTDSKADWKQGDQWLDLRIYRPGQTWFEYPTYTVGQVTLFAAPDTAYPVVSGLIETAQERIELNLYAFTLVPLAEKLAAAARRGVRVRLLLEGGIVGGLTNQGRYIAMILTEAGAEVRFQRNHRGQEIYGRYVFNHAKYAVIDGRRTLVQSENLGVRGTPIDPSYGNRGWGTVVEDVGLAAYLSRVFESNWPPVYGDTIPYQPGTHYGPPSPGFVPELKVPVGEYLHPFPALMVKGSISVTPVLAPDHSLLQNIGVIGLMRSARETLWIEQMYAYKFWGPRDGSPQTTPDIFLEEALQAARRGVSVRILLSDSYLDPSDPRDNSYTVQYVNEVARREQLDLQARLFRSDIARLEKIHNKGIIVDGRKVLVSSINWSYNSPANNREVGLILDHPVIGDYFTDLLTSVMRDTRRYLTVAEQGSRFHSFCQLVVCV